MNTTRRLRLAVASAAAVAAGAVIVSGSTVLAAADTPATGDAGLSTGLIVVGIVAAISLLGLLGSSLWKLRDNEFALPEKASLRGIVGASSRRRPAPEQLDPQARDQLTGLGNRRRLDRDVMAHADRRGITAVMMIDVDQYDAVHDRNGQKAADELVREVGEVLSRNVRFDDVVYRYGTKEFCILLPEATVAEGHLVAARLMTAVHEHAIPSGEQATVSIGISGTHDGRVNQALTGADLALLEAKKSGRDRTSEFALD